MLGKLARLRRMHRSNLRQSRRLFALQADRRSSPRFARGHRSGKDRERVVVDVMSFGLVKIKSGVVGSACHVCMHSDFSPKCSHTRSSVRRKNALAFLVSLPRCVGRDVVSTMAMLDDGTLVNAWWDERDQ